MAKFSVYNNNVVFCDGNLGAILLDDEKWYPFEYKENGNFDIYDEDGGYLFPSSAYKMAKRIFT